MGNHSSGAVVTERLLQPTRTAHVTGYTVPIWFCSGWGLPGRDCYQTRGALLPHPFSFSVPKDGSLLSVALSLRSPSPAINRHPVTWEPGLSSRAETRAIAQPSDRTVSKPAFALWQEPDERPNALQAVYVNQP